MSDKVVVVNGRNPKQSENLLKLTEENRPDLVFLMCGFWFSDDYSQLEEELLEMGISINSIVDKLDNKFRRKLVDGAILRAMSWIKIISHLNDLGCYVFVLDRGDFPVFYKDGSTAYSVDFAQLMEQNLVKEKWKYIRNISIVEFMGFSMVFWPKNVKCQDQLLGYKSDLRRVLVTDQEPSKEQLSLVNPWRVISPYTVKHIVL